VVQRAQKRNASTAGLPNQPSGAPPTKRRTRSAGKPAPDLSKPVLDFTSSYDGVRNQEFRSSQALGFTQSATLTKPANAPLAAATYYDFRQEVKDTWVSIYEVTNQFKQQTSAPSAASWKQDGPYRPTYTNAVIDNTANSIKFNDDPGFSTDREIPPNNWLQSYTVSFRWKVKLKPRHGGGGGTWTSSEITHTLTSTFDRARPDQPQPVIHQAAGAQQWTPTLS
jgi:hypothetical protein